MPPAPRPPKTARPAALAVAAVGLCLAPLGARAAVCSLTGTGEWGPVGHYTGGDTCGGVYGPDDRFVVYGDVTVVADLAQGDDPLASIDVVAGGSLSAAVVDRPLRIDVGPGGLDCRGGGRCDFRGGFRAPRAHEGVSAGEVTDDFDLDALWRLGEPIPCPGWDDSEGLWQPDCAGALGDPGDRPGSDEVLGGHWAGPPDAERRAALAAMRPGEVWYFLDDDPGDPEAGPESGFHYDVVDFAGAPAPGGPTGDYVHLDTVQGGADNGYALSRRRTRACEIAAPVVARSRTIHVRDDCIDADFARDGQWLRFERNGVAFSACPGTAAAPCEAESRTTRIQASENDVPCPGGGTCDRLLLADVRGAPEARAAGGILWISPVGPGAGDPAVVLVPVRLGSSTPPVDEAGEKDSEYVFRGETFVRGVVFDRTGGLWVNGYDVVLERFEDVYLKGPTHDGQLGLNVTVAQDVTLRRVTLTGGEQFEKAGTGGGGNDHGIGFSGLGSGVDVLLEDVSVRYTWDDLIVTSASLPPASLTARRIRTQYEGWTVQSQSGLQVQSPATQAFIEDFECVDCADEERPISLLGGPVGAVRRVLFLSPKSDVVISADGPVEDVTAIGARDTTGSVVAGGRMTRCVLRENRHTGLAGLVSGSPIDLDRCLVQGNETRLDLVSPGFGSRQLTIRDSAFVDNLDADASGDDLIDCRGVAGPAGACVVERTTVAYSSALQADPRRPGTGLRMAGDDDGRDVRASQSVFFGLPVGIDVDDPEETTLQALCFEANDSNAPIDVATAILGAELGPLGLRDPGAGRFDPLPGDLADTTPCGMRAAPEAPGVCQRTWAHAVSRLEPECMAPTCANGADDDFDGLRDYPEDPSCSGPDADDEVPPACGNGVDDDADGLVDLADPGCPDAFGEVENPICDDGLDNDGDGLVDFDDPHCSPGWPHRESAPASCGLGGEAAALLPVLWLARRRRRARG